MSRITLADPCDVMNFCLGDHLNDGSIVIGIDVDRGEIHTRPATWHRRLFWWARGWIRYVAWLAHCHWCDFKEWCSQQWERVP